MADNKADKALKKVIINLTPSEYLGKPVPIEAQVQIDISDKLDANKFYYLENIQVDYKNMTGKTMSYVSYEDYSNFKEKVENILDAAIVNAKQRESLQKLLNSAFYDGTRFDCMI